MERHSGYVLFNDNSYIRDAQKHIHASKALA